MSVAGIGQAVRTDSRCAGWLSGYGRSWIPPADSVLCSYVAVMVTRFYTIRYS